MPAFFSLGEWLRWLDSNQRVRESKSHALPLGDNPLLRMGGLEPPIYRLKASCHTAWLHAHKHRAGIEPAKKDLQSSSMPYGLRRIAADAGIEPAVTGSEPALLPLQQSAKVRATASGRLEIFCLIPLGYARRTQKSRQPFRLTAFQSCGIIFCELLKQR